LLLELLVLVLLYSEHMLRFQVHLQEQLDLQLGNLEVQPISYLLVFLILIKKVK
jgi:hypothetical protein